MGKRGPKPQPTNILLLKGNPGKRPLNDTEPMPPDTSIPDPPSFLDKYAKEEWFEVCHSLHAMGTLTKIDKAVLAAYCDSYSLWRRCNEQLLKIKDPLKAITDTSSGGNSYHSVLVGTANTAKRETIQYADKLGMSAGARRSLGRVSEGGKGKDKWRGLLNAGK